MSSPESYSMGLHLPGLLQILGEHLYSDPRVALREAIQNAHDSCRRRQNELGEEGYEPQIVMRRDGRRTLDIVDNGSGLTPDEVHEFLATIGRSYTGELRGQLEWSDRAAAEGLIGQFGLGLLSAFLLADRVELITRSYQPDSPTLCWRSEGGQTYELETLEDGHAVGSTLRMRLRPHTAFLTDPDALKMAVEEFIGYLGIPVVIEESGAVVSGRVAPWHREDGEATVEEYERFVRDTFKVEPLAVLPLKDHVVEAGRGTITVPLSGCLFVPPSSVTSLQEFGEVQVYVRRMLLSRRERDLLPPWARFVAGVVESSRLRPTVSRESLRQDDLFNQVREGIAQQLLDEFGRLADDEPERWNALVQNHNDLIKGWALKEEALFAAVANLVHFSTSRGRLSLPEIREVTGDKLYYFTEESSSNQEKMLYEASGLLVIDASQFAEGAFLREYCRVHPHVQLEELSPGTGTFFHDAVDGSLRHVAAYFERAGHHVKTVSFEPPGFPALLVYPPGHDRLKRVTDELSGGGWSGPLSELMQDYVERRSRNAPSLGPVLHLNARSPLMQELERRGPDVREFGPALDVIGQSARFFAGKRMTAEEGKSAFDAAMSALTALVQRFPGASG